MLNKIFNYRFENISTSKEGHIFIHLVYDFHIVREQDGTITYSQDNVINCEISLKVYKNGQWSIRSDGYGGDSFEFYKPEIDLFTHVANLAASPNFMALYGK